ncbi:MAG: transglutaminase domain-containing protein [Clostridiales bacterium]|nr:transglutaminase domain-containing protein [Clostridiales bacterium]
MTGRKKRLLIGTAVLLTAVLTLSALLCIRLWPRPDRRVYMDGQPMERQALADYQGTYGDRELLCQPALSGEPLLLYKALQYAYEHQVTSLRLHTRAIYGFEDIMWLVSMLKADQPHFMTTLVRGQFGVERDEEGYLTVTIPAAELAYIADEGCLEEAGRQLEAMPAVPAGELGPQAAGAYGIYAYMVDTIDYQAEGDSEEGFGWNFTIQGALADKKAQCNGIAGAFQLFCRMKGIACYKVYYRGRDVGREYGHVWNLARLDGRWYHIDVTAAIQYKESQQAYFSKEGMSPAYMLPDYFGLSDAEVLTGGVNYTGPLTGRVPDCPSPLPQRDSLYDLTVEGEEAGFADAAVRGGTLLADRQQQDVPALRVRFADQAALHTFRENLFQGERYIVRLMEGIDRPSQVHVMQNGSTLYLYLQPVS